MAPNKRVFLLIIKNIRPKLFKKQLFCELVVCGNILVEVIFASQTVLVNFNIYDINLAIWRILNPLRNEIDRLVIPTKLWSCS